MGPTERSLFVFKAGHGRGGGALCSRTEVAGGRATPTSRKEEEPLLTFLYLSTDFIDVNTDICQAQTTHQVHARGPHPLARSCKERVLAPQTWLRIKALLCSPSGPRVPSRTRADRRTRARASGVAETTSCPGSAWTSLGDAAPQLVRLLRGPGVDRSPTLCHRQPARLRRIFCGIVCNVIKCNKDTANVSGAWGVQVPRSLVLSCLPTHPPKSRS